MQTHEGIGGDAAGEPASTGPARRHALPHVCVIVDERECGLAAVRQAAALGGGARPLWVLMRHRSLLSESLAMVAGVVVPGAKDLRTDNTFRLAAAVLAETGASWEFGTLDASDQSLVADVPTTIVFAVHRGHLRPPWPCSPGVRVIAKAATTLMPVRCDRGRRP